MEINKELLTFKTKDAPLLGYFTIDSVAKFVEASLLEERTIRRERDHQDLKEITVEVQEGETLAYGDRNYFIQWDPEDSKWAVVSHTDEYSYTRIYDVVGRENTILVSRHSMNVVNIVNEEPVFYFMSLTDAEAETWGQLDLETQQQYADEIISLAEFVNN